MIPQQVGHGTLTRPVTKLRKVKDTKGGIWWVIGILIEWHQLQQQAGTSELSVCLAQREEIANLGRRFL